MTKTPFWDFDPTRCPLCAVKLPSLGHLESERAGVLRRCADDSSGDRSVQRLRADQLLALDTMIATRYPDQRRG